MESFFPVARQCPLLSRWLAYYLFRVRTSPETEGEENQALEGLASSWTEGVVKEKRVGQSRRLRRIGSGSKKTSNLSDPLPMVLSFPMACYPNGDLKEPLFQRMLKGEPIEREYPELTQRDAECVLHQQDNTQWDWLLVLPDDARPGSEALLSPQLEPILGFLAEHDELLRTGMVLPWSSFAAISRDTCPCMGDAKNVSPPFILSDRLPPVVGTEAVHTFLSAYLLGSAVWSHEGAKHLAFLRK